MQLTRRTSAARLSSSGLAGAALAAALSMAVLSAKAQAPAPYAGETDPIKAGLMQGYPLAAGQQVSLQNWLGFPHNRWAFRNMQALFPTGAIPRGEGGVRALVKSRALNVETLSFKDADGQTTTVADYFKREHVDGFIVMHKGFIVYEGYFSSMKPTDQHLWQSMTKSVTGLLAEMLIHQGKLDANKPAGEYVPEITDTVWGKATVRELLNMAVAAKEPSTRAAELPADFWAQANFLESLKDSAVTQDGSNGRLFYYTNSAPQAVGLLMTKVTGKAWHQLAHEMIWSKLGSEREAHIWLDRDGQAAAAGGLSTTLRDAARFAEMLRNDGRFNSQQIVPKAVIASLRSSNAANPPANTSQGNVAMVKLRPEMSYKSYWYQANDGVGSTEFLGIFGQHLLINPAEQLSIVQFGSFTGPGPNALNWTGAMKAITTAVAKRP
jgi:CubicO group peptidase (beta-lactamase class C family)